MLWVLNFFTFLMWGVILARLYSCCLIVAIAFVLEKLGCIFISNTISRVMYVVILSCLHLRNVHRSTQEKQGRVATRGSMIIRRRRNNPGRRKMTQLVAYHSFGLITTCRKLLNVCKVCFLNLYFFCTLYMAEENVDQIMKCHVSGLFVFQTAWIKVCTLHSSVLTCTICSQPVLKKEKVVSETPSSDKRRKPKPSELKAECCVCDLSGTISNLVR